MYVLFSPACRPCHVFACAGEAQEWVRLMLTTVGRGGDGQRIRDGKRSGQAGLA